MTPGLLVPERVSARGVAGRRFAWTMTPRTLRLFALGVLLVLLVWLDRRLVVVMAAWDATIFIAWVFDLRSLPAPGAMSVARVWQSAPALSVPQMVSLEVTNDSAVPIDLWIMDLPATTIRELPIELNVAVAARATSRVAYDVTPSVRGDVEMGTAAVRYRGPLGLAERWAVLPLRQTVRVYPDIGEAKRQSLALIRARQIAVERRRARSFGLGRDFESLRQFQDGDEPRDVCWTATARRGRLVTRTYRPERSQTVWIVVDTGRLMRAREGVHTRLDRAVNAAFALARIASAAGDRVGLLAYGRGFERRVAPARGAAHLRGMLEMLATVSGGPVEADHVRAAGVIMTAQKRRALVVWLTDVTETAAVPEVIESASRLVPTHVLLFAVMRPAELARLAAEEPSDARDLFRVMAAQEMAERRAKLLADLRQRGALVAEVPSAALTGVVIDRYLGVKERNLL
jgi:uncharacterized protein (DUF58 family)